MKSRNIEIGSLLLACFMVATILVPLFTMLLHAGQTDISAIIGSVQFVTALRNSVVAATISTAISLFIAFCLAWCMTRTCIRFKGILSLILVLPMLIPSISHGMGLIILFGANGIITNALSLKSTIYGFWGVVFGSVLYSFPVAFMMLVDVLKYEDYSPYEAADVLGIPRWRQYTAITLPYLRKPLISVVFATFTLIFTDYGVPLIVGGKFITLPVMMYQEVIGLLNFSKGSMIGIMLLVPAIAAFIMDMFNRDKGNSAYVVKQFTLKKNVVRDTLSYAVCGLTALIVTVTITSFGLLAFTTKYPSNLSVSAHNITKTLSMNGGIYLINSIIIALLVSVVGIAVSFATAYLTARVRTRMSRFLHLVAITSLAIPGIVLGLSYVLVLKGSFIYGTIAVMVLVNMVHFFASPYLMMYNTLGKININLEAVGMTLGISRLRLIKDVLIPQVKTTIIEMLSYFFVNSMMTISAVSFLATTNNKPISLMINQFEAQMMLECSAFVSILILGVNMVVKGSIYLAKRRILLGVKLKPVFSQRVTLEG